VLPEVLYMGKWDCLCPMRRIVQQFKASDIISPIGPWRSPQYNTSGE
jgi:hypothetical protein